MKTRLYDAGTGAAPRAVSRRAALKWLASSGALALGLGLEAASDQPRHLGVCSISYLLRWPKVDRGQAALADILTFIEHCRQAGAGGVQTHIPVDQDYVMGIRRHIESTGLFLEGQVALPGTQADLATFEARVRAAREAGARVLRTACLGGRRYETFNSAQAFREFAERAERSLVMAEPIMRKHQVRLAVENHKDWLVPEMLALLRRLSSEYIGVCVDTGNSIALLEDPLAVVEAYAPFAFATHLKDMAVQECENGFLLAEVPLGEGFLDLPAIVKALRRARPDLQFCLEMITRDPLVVPCLARSYWTTFDNVAGSELAAALARVRANSRQEPLPRVTQRSEAEKLAMEDSAVRKSLVYSRQHLGL